MYLMTAKHVAEVTFIENKSDNVAHQQAASTTRSLNFKTAPTK
jgi:hypothetical protein